MWLFLRVDTAVIKAAREYYCEIAGQARNDEHRHAEFDPQSPKTKQGWVKRSVPTRNLSPGGQEACPPYARHFPARGSVAGVGEVSGAWARAGKPAWMRRCVIGSKRIRWRNSPPQHEGG